MTSHKAETSLSIIMQLIMYFTVSFEIIYADLRNTLHVYDCII